MQPIPVPELANSNAPLWIILLVVGAVLAVAGFATAIAGADRLSGKATALFFVMGAVGFSSIIVGGMLQFIGSPTWYMEHEAQAKEASVQIEDSYGLELSSAEIIDLYWPEEAPSESFKVYGSVVNQKQVEGAKFEERTIYLVWADGKLQLSESEDGKSFAELEATK